MVLGWGVDGLHAVSCGYRVAGYSLDACRRGPWLAFWR